MTVLSSRGRLVPAGGCPTAVAERLWTGWPGEALDLPELLWFRGLSFPFLRDWAADVAAFAVSSGTLSRSLLLVYAVGCGARDMGGLLFPEVAVEAGLRCDEERGGGRGPPADIAVVGVVVTGDE
jgi:hypothetical protein